MKDFRAFTLAEVLITLGVIGVVAAMTMPTLIKNYQKKTWVTQLQKTYSVFEQGFQLLLADEGVSKLSDTPLSPQISGKLGCGKSFGPPLSGWDSSDCSGTLNVLNKYFKFIGVEEYGTTSKGLMRGSSPISSSDLMLVLPDGAMIDMAIYSTTNSNYTCSTASCDKIKGLGGNVCSMAGEIIIDVNGRKGPNIYGRDIFYFKASDEGKLYPDAGKDYAIYIDNNNSNKIYSLEESSRYWRNSTNKCGIPNGGLTSDASGEGCAARIIENGWKMDY